MAITETISEEFQKRFAAWLRIEPRCRQDDFAKGIQACIADPLWMLTRQWQTGEFLGEDTGSPIKVELRYSTQSVDRIKLGDSLTNPLQPGVPLETVVEQELGEIDYRERVRIGQEFERRLHDKLVALGVEDEFDALVTALRNQETVGFPVPPETPMHELDRATQRFVQFMRGRVVDGIVVLTGSIIAPGTFSVPQIEIDFVRVQVLAWYAKVCRRPISKQPPAWQPEKLDYRFEANTYPADSSAPDAVEEDEQKTRLIAPDYRNGTVDWYTFIGGPEGPRGPWEAPTEDGLDPIITTPTRIEVSGTSTRWWAFEDGNTDFGDMDVAKPDLAKLLLMEFVLIYGDDWFSIPAPVSIGSLVKVDELKVLNVFGEEMLVKPARKIAGDPTERFDLFTISPQGAPLDPGIAVDVVPASDPPRPILFIPPVTGFRQESPPLDEVQFLRDEGANMVWGVEYIVPNGLGRPVSGFDAQRERIERERAVELDSLEDQLGDLREQLLDEELNDGERCELLAQANLVLARIEELTPHAQPPPSQEAVPRYRLATTVPQNWIPFIPAQRQHSPTSFLHPVVEFRRAQMLQNTDHARLDAGEIIAPEPVPSMSRLLALDEDALLWINEEAIPRAGLRVQLTKQRARWIDGSTHVWLGRKVTTGRGEGSSGLKFDVLK